VSKQTQDAPAKDTPTLAQFVDEWIDANCRAMSIDAILSRPLDALRMGVEVGARQQRISPRDLNRWNQLISLLVKKHAEELEIVDEICRGALNLRKRGQLNDRKN
jgi:hypothetical protein